MWYTCRGWACSTQNYKIYSNKGPLSRACSLLNFLPHPSLSLSLSLYFLFFNKDPNYFSYLCCHILSKGVLHSYKISSVEEKLNAEREKTMQIYYKDTKHGCRPAPLRRSQVSRFPYFGIYNFLRGELSRFMYLKLVHYVLILPRQRRKIIWSHNSI